jgi:hypothetical protein
VAPVLQCPDCGQKHPLDGVRHTPAFRCNGCGRMLKVPQQLLPAAPEPPPPSHFPPRRLPAMRAPAAALPELPRIVRFLIWIVALPLAFLLTFLLARLFGLLNQNQLEDTFLRTGWDRFWPVARVLPLWALITTVIVHFGNVGIAKWLVQRRGGGSARGTGSSHSRSRGRGRGSGLSGLSRGSAPARTAPGAESTTQTSRVS